MKRTNCEAFSGDNYEKQYVAKKQKESPDLIRSHHINSLNFNDMPDEVMVKIFSYLSISELYYGVRLVCERWYRLAMDYKLWKAITITDDIPFDDIKLWLKSALILKHLTIHYRSDIEKILRQVRINCVELQTLEIINFKVPHQKKISPNVLRKFLLKCRKLKIISLFGAGSTSQFFFCVLARSHYKGNIKKRIYTKPLNIKHLLGLLGTLQGHYTAAYRHFEDTRKFNFQFNQICKWKVNSYPESYLNTLRNLIKFAVL